MREKKAFVELQFNWIFVIIIGGILIFFFISVVSNQKKSAEASLRQEVLKSLESVVTSATVNLGSTNQIRLLPNAEVSFECNKIYVNSKSKTYDGLVLFALNKIKGQRLITQTLDYSIPFRVANVVIASSDDARYILIGGKNNKLAEEANRTISDKFNKILRQGIVEYTDGAETIPEVKDEKNYKVRFVFFSMNDFDSKKGDIANIFSKTTDVTATIIEGNSDKVYYKKLVSRNWEDIGGITYFKISTLLGAIFLDADRNTVEQYDCIIRNIESKSKIIVEIYKQKTLKLLEESNAPNSQLSSCSQDYTEAKNIFANFNPKSPSSLSDIEGINRNLQEKSCPLIY